MPTHTRIPRKTAVRSSCLTASSSTKLRLEMYDTFAGPECSGATAAVADEAADGFPAKPSPQLTCTTLSENMCESTRQSAITQVAQCVLSVTQRKQSPSWQHGATAVVQYCGLVDAQLVLGRCQDLFMTRHDDDHSARCLLRISHKL